MSKYKKKYRVRTGRLLQKYWEQRRQKDGADDDNEESPEVGIATQMTILNVTSLNPFQNVDGSENTFVEQRRRKHGGDDDNGSPEAGIATQMTILNVTSLNPFQNVNGSENTYVPDAAEILNETVDIKTEPLEDRARTPDPEPLVKEEVPEIHVIKEEFWIEEESFGHNNIRVDEFLS